MVSPPTPIDRLRHYFSTYKMVPGEEEPQISIEEPDGVEHALKVDSASLEDFDEEFGR